MRACLLSVWAYFAPKHYVCRICGVASANADDLCFPVEKEFKG